MTPTFQSLQENPVTRILELIERCAPRLMTSGGGGLRNEQPHNGKPVDADDAAEMNRRIVSGESIRTIAIAMEYAPSTVANYTKKTRQRIARKAA